VSRCSPFVIELSEADRRELDRRVRCYTGAHARVVRRRSSTAPILKRPIRRLVRAVLLLAARLRSPTADLRVVHAVWQPGRGQAAGGRETGGIGG
jgi:hypothetical protein